jgi:tRNA U34 5-methylaminomethyl-2-thiouridine-forming methyltransferase MnmC
MENRILSEMKKEIVITGDGSRTIAIPELDVLYHSRHGAMKESMHVYIEAGLQYLADSFTLSHISIFELGFGTGLNAFLSCIEAEKKRIKMHYTTIEPFPISIEEADTLCYSRTKQENDLFRKLHECNWNEDVHITPYFSFRKERTSISDFSSSEIFNLLYYDAFAPAAQPELWTSEIFIKLYSMMSANSVLVTYCSKGDVKRAMLASGFQVTKLPGPPGKREMLRAIKPNS